jgi:WD40 repeat protein
VLDLFNAALVVERVETEENRWMWSCVSKTVSVSDSWVLDVMCVGASSLCCLNSNQTRQVTLHDTSTMQVTWSASPHAGIASDVQVFSDQLLVSCGRDGTVALLDSRARQPTALLRVGGAVNSVTAGSAAGNAVIAAASGSCLFVFDPRTLRLAARLEGGHADDEEAVAVRANGPLLASGGTDGVVALWSGESGWSEEESLIEVLNEEVAVSRLDWRGSMLFVSSLQQASLWRDGQLVWTLPDNGAYIPLGPALGKSFVVRASSFLAPHICPRSRCFCSS